MCSAALPCEESCTAWAAAFLSAPSLPLDGLCCVSHICIPGIWGGFFLRARVSGLVHGWDPSPSPRTAAAGCGQGLHQQTSHCCSVGLRGIAFSDCSYFSDVLLLYESWQPVCNKCLQYISVNTWCVIIICIFKLIFRGMFIFLVLSTPTFRALKLVCLTTQKMLSKSIYETLLVLLPVHPSYALRLLDSKCSWALEVNIILVPAVAREASWCAVGG